MIEPPELHETGAYKRVRLPVEYLVNRLERECRDQEAQALRDLLQSHRHQRLALQHCHRELAAATARLRTALAADALTVPTQPEQAA